uniref:Uncharacterized protein n=1 Tax=Anguilla anguilla TaxID=7936 RepID=A0A0E9X8D5_ANGAN
MLTSVLTSDKSSFQQLRTIIEFFFFGKGTLLVGSFCHQTVAFTLTIGKGNHCFKHCFCILSLM